MQLSVITADKAYDSEDNHVLVRDVLHTLSVIPARYEHVPIGTTHGKYRKQMKRSYSKLLYNQRSKNEAILSVIKRLFGEHITSRSVKTQNRVIIQMHSIQHPQIDSSHYNIRWFLLSPYD